MKNSTKKTFKAAGAFALKGFYIAGISVVSALVGASFYPYVAARPWLVAYPVSLAFVAWVLVWGFKQLSLLYLTRLLRGKGGKR